MSRFFFVSLAMLFLAPYGTARAASPCCESCGCQPCTRKVCRLVCEKKKVPKPTYKCVCEDFCLPGPSKLCKVPCNDCCDEDCHSWCPLLCAKKKEIWTPSCGCVRTRVNLVIVPGEKEVPSYKCVVEEVCGRCGHCGHCTTYPSAKDPATAIAMVKDAGIEQVVGADPSLQAEVMKASHEAAAAQTEVASRSFFTSVFSRK